LRVGRSSDNDLVIHDPSVSSHHAVLHVQDGVVEIEDLGSKNGTEIDGRQLSTGERVTMERSRVITFGSMRCRYCEPEVLYEVLHLLALGGR
jgi:pSer/pThr/pTyr-binding forkhead associated (FHA) protein